MRDLSLHLLDLAQNSITAGASLVTIRLTLGEDVTEEELEGIRRMALYGVVTGRENDMMVTGGTWVYTFETPDGEYLMSIEMYRGLVVSSDGMYSYRISSN